MEKKYNYKWGIIINILIVAFISFCGVMYVREISEKIVNQNKVHVEEVTVQISENISSKIQSYIHSLKLIGNNLVLNDMISREELSKVLQFEIESGLFSEMIVVDLNGEGIDSKNKPINIGERKYFKDTLKGNISVSEPLDSSIYDENIIVYAVPLIRGGKVIGAICGINNSELVKNQLQTSVYGNKGCYYILTGDGSVILETHIQHEDSATRSITNKKIGDLMKHITSGLDTNIPDNGVDIADIYGEQKYVAYSKVKSASGWYVVTTIPMSSVFIDANNVVLDTVIVLILCLLGLIILNIYILKTNYDNNKKLNKAVYEDHLTEINNYEKFIIDCNEYLHNNDKNKYAFLLFDIQKFKVLNDIYGYQIGDNILKEISKNLQYIFKDSAIYARLTGDTFGILIEIEDIDDDVSNLSNIIKEEVANPDNMVSLKLNVKIDTSIGVCIVDRHDGRNIQKLIDNADMARFKSKSMKHKDYLVFDEIMREEKKIKMKLEQDLSLAIENKELHIYYQPKFDTELGGIIGAEALLRWNHPTMGFVPPDKFIPIAEKNGYINEIGKWVFNEVCKTIKLWKDESIDVVPVSVNLSRVELYQDNLISFLQETLKLHNVPSKLVELEITESTTLNNNKFIRDKIHQIKKLGIKVSMDDFGVGNSNISNLKDMPIDVLKIDRSILIDIETNIKSKVVVESIINICKHLELDVVGEGVENIGQVEILKNIGCRVIQGYIFYKPVNQQQYKNLLENKINKTELLIEEVAIDNE